MVKNKIKRLIPKNLIKLIILIRNFIFIFFNYYYDFKRFIFKSSTLKSFSEKNKESKISANYHALEKGLAMKDKKLIFGIVRSKELINDLKTYLKQGYNLKSSQFLTSINVLNEYFKYHQNSKDDKIIELEKTFKTFCEKNNISIQLSGGSKEVKDMNNNSRSIGSFKQLAEKRNSVRDFLDVKLDIELLTNSILIASNTPTTCNRQPNKVYYLSNKEKVQEVLKLQNGNAGWGHSVGNLLICTTNQEYYSGVRERNQAQIDGGMFCMSLVYALEENNISNCTLNWCVDYKQDQKLRKKVNISDSEIVIMMIAVGSAPEKYLVTNSQKRKLHEIFEEIK